MPWIDVIAIAATGLLAELHAKCAELWVGWTISPPPTSHLFVSNVDALLRLCYRNLTG